MRALAVVLAVTLPGSALADCVYMGAKRAYVQCIYDATVQNASEILALAGDFLGVSDRVTDTETRLASVEADLASDVNGLQAGLGAVQTDLSALQSDVGALDGTLAGLLLDVGALQSATSALQANDSAQDDAIAGLQATADGLTASLSSLSSQVATLSSTLSALDGDVASGFYTPTATADQGVSSLQASRGLYTRIGDVVHVSVRVDGVSTAAAEKVAFLTVPFASGAPLTSQDVIGPCVYTGNAGETIVGHGAAIPKTRGGTSATQIEIRWYDDNTAGQGTGVACSFQYAL
ncbi:MAG TPA: hypothetical protein PKA64_09405 [Myxococcota bacterium]|nr:hypothetical protein [Myxococcota bacterium]